jgi:mannose-6-phosphate isomerase-like protein (cupin superfamily)
MHALHPENLPEQITEVFPFRELLPAEIGGAVSIYLLTVKHANPHSHDEAQIYIVQSGHGIIEIDGEQQEVGPGWLVHIPGGSVHSLTPTCEEPVVVYSIICESQSKG